MRCVSPRVGADIYESTHKFTKKFRKPQKFLAVRAPGATACQTSRTCQTAPPGGGLAGERKIVIFAGGTRGLPAGSARMTDFYVLMSRILRNMALWGLAALCAGVASGQQTRMLTGEKSNEYGVVYSLPLTELVVDATCRVTTRVPGPYRDYARRYLGAEAAVPEASSRVELTGVEMAVRGVAGPQKYLMQMKPGALASLCVAQSGMLLAVNTEAEEPALPALPADGGGEAPDMDEYLRYVDADYMSSLSSAKRAQLLAQAIMEIRDSRLSLSRGTAETMPADGRQLELMLSSLERQEEALMRAFNGYEHTFTQTRRFTFLPDSASAQGEETVLFRLSDTEGFCDAEDWSGEPARLSLSLVQAPQMPLDLKGEPKAMPRNAVAYALPGTASVSLEWMGEQVCSNQLDFAQLGCVFGLDPKLFTDRRKPSMAVFNPATGALVSVTECP